MSLKAILPLGIFAALVIMLAVGLTLKPKELPSEFIDKPLPTFELENLFPDQPPVSSEDLKGDFFLLNVFGSWCVACQVEHPYLMELQEEGQIRLVGLDWRDKREDAIAWLDRLGNPYDEIGFDEHSEVAIGLGITGAPETFLVDPEGRIRYKLVGPMTPEIWETDFLPRIHALRNGTAS